MEGKVSIFIEGTNRENNERITTRAVGESRLLNGKNIIRYKETDRENGKCTDNTLKISPGLVEMIKKGDVSTRMVFDLTRDTYTEYNTPYGRIRFKINTTRIDIENREKELIVNMEYSLFQNNEPFSEKRIKITLKEIK